MANDLNPVRLINAEALRNKLKPIDGRVAHSNEWTLTGLDIAQAPSVDAAPVIRCKDCKYYTNNMHDPNLRDGFCRREQAGAFYHVKDNDFCSFGAKMDEGKDDV